MLASLLLTLACAAPALPQDPAEPSKSPSKSPWSGGASAGLIYVTGNNPSTLSSADVSAKYEQTGYRWIFTGKYAAIRQEDRVTSDPTTTSRLYQGAVEHHRFLDAEDNLYLYGKGSARRDVPNGLQVREDAGVGVGYTWRWNDGKSDFSAEGGPSALKENNVAVPSGDMALNGRAALRYDSALSDSTKLLSKAEYFQSFDVSEDRSATADAKLRWNLEGSWYLEGGVAMAWDNTPAPGFRNTDVIYSIQVGTTF